jgi:two-component system cell cycle response regulator
MRKEQRLRFLVVDDDEDIRDILCFMLKGYNGIIMTASNGIEAFNICQTIEIDIIISDIRMPLSDGVELLTKVKSNNFIKVPIVILMSAASKYNVEELYQLGADGFLEKPFKSDSLNALTDFCLKSNNSLNTKKSA